ncbi:DEAD/DEAH box helicase [Allochromatium vinosum]|uniref:DEAD/DEAH box helicase n=1 Tax=Allochromatium vinosum TaxID=1049 RepID=UPI001906D109|nr:DEAD/DEAH box helicase [Allochromatium vinosum]MBK1656037.1 helicase [Allochromatium vinosum]
MIELRPYQTHMVHDLRDAYRAGAKSPLLVAPTGSGKTVLFSYVSWKTIARGGRVLILVHRQELLRQTSATLSAFEIGHGLMAPGQPATDDAVQVASVQTLVRRLERLDWTPTLIVVDEAHHTTATTAHGRVLAHFDEARVLGVTATPCRLDGKGLGVEVGGFFDTLIEGPSVAELTKLGFLSPSVVYAPPCAVDLSGVASRGGDFAQDALAEAMDKPSITGDAVLHYRKYCAGQPSIAFCVSVAHAEHVAEAFRAAGFQAASIDGTMDDATRAQRIADLGSGALNVLTSCEIISEGTDIPRVSGAISLRPTQSLALYLQQVGRVLRPFPGKREAVILDHVGNVHRHGLPDDPRQWDLNATKRTKRRREQDEAEVRIRQCEQCYTVHRPAPKCPSCGFVYPVQGREIEQVAGELTRVDPAEIRRLAKREQSEAQSLAELQALAARRGYKPGWAEHVWRSRQQRQRFGGWR